MASQPLSVADAVNGIISISVLAQHIPPSLIQIGGGHAGPYPFKHLQLGLYHCAEGPLGWVGGPSDEEGAFQFGVVAVDGGLAHVDDHISPDQAAAGGIDMGHNGALHTGGGDTAGRRKGVGIIIA